MTLHVRRYCLLVVGMIGLFFVVGYALSLFGIDLPTGISIIVPPMLAAMIEGQRYANETGQPLASAAAWRMAMRMTPWALLVQANVFAFQLLGLTYYSGEDISQTLGFIGTAGWVAVFAIALVVTFISNRIGVGTGVKTQLKARGK